MISPSAKSLSARTTAQSRGMAGRDSGMNASWHSTARSSSPAPTRSRSSSPPARSTTASSTTTCDWRSTTVRNDFFASRKGRKGREGRSFAALRPLREATPMKTRLKLSLSLAFAVSAQGAGVTVTETETEFSLANELIIARISKRSGDLTSMTHRGVEMLTDKSGHAGGYWSHDTTGGKETLTGITIDPRKNDGARAEVSVKAISGGKLLGHGPGVPKGAEGDLAVDIEIRWTLGRGES